MTLCTKNKNFYASIVGKKNPHKWYFWSAYLPLT
jgi:hypothetical protein